MATKSSVNPMRERRASQKTPRRSSQVSSLPRRLTSQTRNLKLQKGSLPLLGAGLAGGAGLVIASAVGAAELAVGAAAAYAAFRILGKKKSSSSAS